MAGPKLKVFNLVQMVITVVAIMFGLYGFIRSDDAPTNAPVIACAPVDEAPETNDRNGTPLPTPEWTPPTANDWQPSTEPVVVNPDDRGTGKLPGTVAYSDGRAADGLRVTAISTQVNSEFPVWDNEDLSTTREEYDHYIRNLQRNTRETVTDSNGRFEFSGLDASHSYTVSVGDREMGISTQTVQPGNDLKFSIEVPVMLNGVVKADGTLGRFSVNVEAKTNGYWSSIRFATFDDPDGKFRIRAQEGKVRVRVTASGYVQEELPEVSLDASGGDVTVDLARAAVLTGVVSTIDGTPLPNVSVSIGYKAGTRKFDSSESPRRSGRIRSEKGDIEAIEIEQQLKSLKVLVEQVGGGLVAHTDSDGRYRIENIPVGSHTVTAAWGRFNDSRAVSLGVGENTADFALETGSAITITATDTSGEKVTPSWAGFMSDKKKWAQAMQLAGQNGELTYLGLDAGNYTMQVNSGSHPVVRQEVYIGPGTNSVSVVFPEPAVVKGSVSAGGAELPNGLAIQLVTKGAEPSKGYVAQGSAQVSADGDYAMKGIAPGNYEIRATLNWSEVLYTGEIWVAAGKNTHDIVLDPGASLTVTVNLDSDIEASTVSVSVSRVEVMDKNPGRKRGRTPGGMRYGRLDENNQAHFSMMGEGEYRVVVYAKGAIATTETVNLVSGLSQTVSVNLGKSNSVKIARVAEGTQAAEAGLEVGDVIIEYNGITAESMQQLGEAVRATKPEDNVTLLIERNGRTLSFAIKGGRIGINGTDHHR